MADNSPIHRVRLSNAWRKWAVEQGHNPEVLSGQVRKVAKADNWSREWKTNVPQGQQLDEFTEDFLHLLSIGIENERAKLEVQNYLIEKVNDGLEGLTADSIPEQVAINIDSLVNWSKGLKNDRNVYSAIAEVLASSRG